ncbi:MAG: ATP-dependent DNA helicase RecG [Bacillota bacterium]|jgi:ATP-dependent DNA helicase RecG|nr:ATP-dependent DNA helicase RecG [Candidatus Fermentithermobacillaceae bacterium]HOA70628.1 ATP-dependent DNA helicase RecG [Bacillota bacterium]HOP70469.1 ATP-dependent DNA helicase RecG [Bacillota bacterium]HPT34983.1 ATP-dependent DNA helicase RecG [Bacillota bacterium]HPZ84975.1 ATP-dependent DNA helicase RecG [Bacillota bacterium]
MMLRRLSLQDDVRYIKGVGPRRAKMLAALGVKTVQDLLDFFPFRIDDFSRVQKLKDLRPGEKVTVAGRVVSVSIVPSIRGRALRVGISDGTGTCYLVWYNMVYMAKQFYRGQQLVASGKVEWRRRSWELAHPRWEQTGEFSGQGLIVPIYHATAGLNSSMISRIVREALDTYGHLIDECLPEPIRRRQGLLSQKQAYVNIHCPRDTQMWEKARRTLAFREVFFLQFALLLMKSQNERAKPVAPYTDFSLPQAFIESLPFKLTGAQQRTIDEIREDLRSGRTMNRLLQGDVGSGKTVVAVWSLLAAVANGYQAAFLAPTEVLARQHYKTVVGFTRGMARVGLLSGSQSAQEKRITLERLAEGLIDILVGTHAMLEPDVRWARLGLVVTDEQHRFGVRQRLRLSYESNAPHMLVMSATPIPRSLAITLFGDLDLSVIDELPQGRKRVYTKVFEERSRHLAYERVKKEVAMGHQAYVVCPVIRQSKSGRRSVEQVYEELKTGYLRGVNVGLAHGDMPREDLAKAMQEFVEGKVQVLVATTVIEVGVDVENATCIVIEGAESFGLATLHQLRGRVGRGSKQSYCFMIFSGESAESAARLKALENLHDGFSVAELDLRQRGPGQFFGLKQHGVSEINIQDLGVTQDILYSARQEAKALVDAIEASGQLPLELSPLLSIVNARFGNLLQHARSR